MPENLKWLLIGGAIVMVGESLWTSVLAARRRGPEQKAQEAKIQNAQNWGEQVGEARIMQAHLEQWVRLIQLLELMSNFEPAVYGHQVPFSPSWESLSLQQTGAGPVVYGISRGVEVSLNPKTGVAVVKGKNDGIRQVGVDLKTEIPASTTTALLKLFTDKKAFEQRTKDQEPTPVG